MCSMFPDPDDIRRLQTIRSEGFNPEADNFNEFLGIDKGDFKFLLKLVEEIEDSSEGMEDAFRKLYEVASYATDEIVKSFLFFHLGVEICTKAARKLVSEKEDFTKGFAKGFSEGFKAGFDKAFEIFKELGGKGKED